MVNSGSILPDYIVPDPGSDYVGRISIQHVQRVNDSFNLAISKIIIVDVTRRGRSLMWLQLKGRRKVTLKGSLCLVG